MNISFLVGRLLYGGFFLYSGLNHFRPDVKRGLTQYAGAKGVPYPEWAVVGSGAVMALGGASILSGVQPKAGAAILAGVVGCMTPSIHDFWNADAEHAASEMANFGKNVALIGAAFLLLSVETPWPMALPPGSESE